MNSFLQNRPVAVLVALILLTSLVACKGNEKKPSGTKPVKVSSDSEPMKHAGPEFIGGTVEETMNSGGYTYMLLSIGKDKIWVATPQFQVAKGDNVVLMPGQTMKNFHSKTLNRTFETVIFSPGPVDGPPAHGAMRGDRRTGARKAASHGKTMAAPVEGIKVDKAAGPNAFTIAELYEKAAELDGKTVTVRGIVVKVAKNIMGKQWFHMQDGSGSPEKGNFDLTVTTSTAPEKGQTVTATGKLAYEKDFGYGYHYKIIVEDATVR